MKKRFLQVTVAVAFMVLMLSLAAFAGEGITDKTEQRYEAAIAHLNELYIKKYPKGALTVYQGSYKDKKTLENAAKKITKGAKTDEEKAKKIYEWVDENIEYNVIYSSVSIDVYNSRKSQCYGFSNLTRDLLRFAGIPAVTVTGWRGGMTGEWVQREEELYTQEVTNGHAWTMVYINGKWELIDCLFDDYMPEKEYIIQWIYIDRVENLVPYYKGVYIPEAGMYYKNGKIVYLDENGKEITEGGYFAEVNNISVRWPYDAYLYQKLDGGKKLSEKKIMGKADAYVRYQVFNKKIPLAPIKIKPDGTIQNYHTFTYKKNTVYTSSSGETVFLDRPVKEVEFAAGGNLKLMKGEKIKIYPLLESVKKKYGITYKYCSDDTGVLTVDKNGYVKGVAFGYAMLEIKLYDKEDECFHSVIIEIAVEDGKTKEADGPAGAVLTVDRKIIDNDSIRLEWKKYEDITEYIVLQKDEHGNYNRIGTTKNSSFVVNNLGKKDYLYEFQIKSVLKRGGGVSYGSGTHVIVHGTPTKVKGLDYEKISLNGNKASVTLYWWHIGEDSPFWRDRIFDCYQIYQLKDGKWKKIGKTDPVDYAQFIVKNLKPGKTYSFKVRAVSSGEGNGVEFSEKTYGKFSKVIKVTVPENIGTVKNVKKSLSGTTLKLSWSKVREADKYMVYEYNAKSDSWKKVATVKGTSATLKKVSKGKTHQYKVRAYDKAEKSTGDILVRTGTFSKVIKVKVK